jgi:hypothetical protein
MQPKKPTKPVSNSVTCLFTLCLLAAACTEITPVPTSTPVPQNAPPVIVVNNATGLTGTVSLDVQVTDPNGDDTVEGITVEQEFNSQATGNKQISEYISNESLGEFTIQKVSPYQYTVSFQAEYPGRFPLHITATDKDGNTTEERIPVEIYWAEQPFEIRGLGTGWIVPGDPQYLDTYFDNLLNDNVNFVQILIRGFMPTLTSSDIQHCDYEESPATPCEGGPIVEITRLIEKAHERGLLVMLAPQLMIENGRGSWEMDPNWSEWFSLEEDAPSYSNWILSLARYAQENNVEFLSLGNELIKTHTQRASWVSLLDAVREVYTGKITYDDNYWVFFYGGNEGPFPACEALDYYGLNFYYRGSGGVVGEPAQTDTSFEEMKVNLSQQVSERFLPVLDKCGSIPIFISEMGLGNFDGANQHPESSPEIPFIIDNQEQADYLTAVLEIMSEYSWFKGAVVWSYQPNPDPWTGVEGLPGDMRGLPFEDALRIFYAP